MLKEFIEFRIKDTYIYKITSFLEKLLDLKGLYLF